MRNNIELCSDISFEDLESKRLDALLKYQVLDSVEESMYDDVTQLAAAICGTPVALISLIDKDRQWFKSHHGTPLRQLPRQFSFCNETIKQRELFYIPDTTKDPRFSSNPIVLNAPFVRFYAGTPLISPTGHAIGTLCVIDLEPRTLNEEQKRALTTLSRQVVGMLELRLANINLELEIEEKERLEKQVKAQSLILLNAAKFASLGEMAAGIAHEINNPLAIIRGKVDRVIQLNRKQSQPNEKMEEDLKKVAETTVRIATIIRGLQTFSRSGDKDAFEPASYEIIISDTVALCAEKFKNHGVKLNVNIKKPIVQSIECRRVQISQVILNLLNNAFDAVTEIKTETKNQSEAWVNLETSVHGGELFISVTNSGKKIPEQIASKLMEPFFTTKEVGKGTGLGLSISKGIIDDHSGKLFLDTAHTNTRFVVSIPLAQVKTKIA